LSAPSPLVATLDVGTSSVRSLLFGVDGREVDGFGDQVTYQVRTTPDGGFEMDPDALVDFTAQALDKLCGQLRDAHLKPAAVGIDTFWHSVTGIDGAGKPVTPILHLFDTRSAHAAEELKGKIDNAAQHRRTGCVLHPSYYPAKLLWLSETQPDVFAKVKLWASFGEYLFLRLFGDAVTSTSMVSGTGLWNQNKNEYDAEIMAALPVRLDQFAAPKDMDQPRDKLRPEWAQRWPELDGIPWFPALGDGACNNVGSGCTAAGRFAIMVGTSGAMRAVSDAPSVEIPPGLWCYHVDRRRFVLGGALSNGGSVYAWLSHTLQLPEKDELERQLEAMQPGAHGLTVLPLFAGERSTGWRADARAAFVGVSAHTSPVEIARAAMEAVALTFQDIDALMVSSLGVPKETLASGGALLHSPAWTQMMADAIGRPVMLCTEKEATSRGAALLALERIKAIPDAGAIPAATGKTFMPEPAKTDIYKRLQARQHALYHVLIEDKW
jgi:gluconokinase